ncbi:DUF4407 domain-containing protein [Chryseobacterium sp. HSC-36S06]|uniref:DUF4407 domain-containing protein n=1 Tax=Chryseobacterium sp. HSC-36S06 TaxID=2910970 RepID=UPI00209FCF27|nr:DUF4407 domain-containing protein [Chryseobacterium sp. HSC-36S06]MCP2038182.1 hypothetical protein [Chryseobacterium sp. HSC-36S06]
MKNNESYKMPRAGRFMHFLWDCAGGDRFLLERATYSDQIKYLCLGGIVLSTGLMASLAGGYAFYTIFSPKVANVLDKQKMVNMPMEVPVDIPTVVLSVIFGIIWGLIIFNIDRFIVAATGKGDGTEKITGQEFKGAVPRILMGTIIAITISKPVEIRMFKSEIDAALAKYQEVQKNEAIKRADVNYATQVAQAKVKMKDLDTQIMDMEAQIKELNIQIMKETTGQNGNGAAFGPRAEALEKQRNNIQEKINNLKSTQDFKDLQSELKQAVVKRDRERLDAEKKAGAEDGLLRRIQLADEIAATREDGTKGFPWISLFITLLFMAIELTPVFFKMMLTKSPYDYIKDNLEDELRAENGIEVRYDYYEDKNGLERHLVVNHDAENLMYEKSKLSQIQKELTDYALQKYKEREQANIDANLDLYIQKNT